MKHYLLVTLVCVAFQSIVAQQLKSPNQKLQMEFSLQKDGAPSYTLNYKGKAVIKPSKLGLELKDDAKSLLNDFTINSFNPAKKSGAGR